jgi:tetratricopeptide (TPR) repeat protein
MSEDFSTEEILLYIKQGLKQAKIWFEQKEDKLNVILLKRILKLNPDNIDAGQMLGLTYYRHEKYDKAIQCFEQILQYYENIEMYNNLALSHFHLGQYCQAIDILQKALKINDNNAYLHCNLGLQFRSLNQLKEAISCFEKSLTLKATAYTWCMLGGCHEEQQNLDIAKECFLQALSLEPNSANAHCCLANNYQLRGQWEKAWPEYEWRFKNYPTTINFVKTFDLTKQWKGESLKNKKIIVFSEQGIGDSIHFFRYVPLLKQQEAYVIVHCPESLKSLYQPHVDEVYTLEPHEKTLPSYDYFASLLSLPYLLNNPSIPQPPYLFTNKKFEIKETEFKIGIIWGGNPQHPNDIYRSCYLRQFREISKLPVKLFSLQKDLRLRKYRFQNKAIDLTEDCADLPVVNLSDYLETFEDTASIMKEMDLIITVDTSALHLAGAIGVPTWALIPKNTDWRWKISGETTEWYPTVKLFRQTILGNWDSVFMEMIKELSDLIQQKKGLN